MLECNVLDLLCYFREWQAKYDHQEKKTNKEKQRNKQNKGTPLMARCTRIVEVEQRVQTAEAISSHYCINDWSFC